MTDQFTRLTTALAGRYRIERELGQGGMATVYLAEDIKHDRKVALKVLKPELAAVIGAERFIVEIKTTAALQHPHILPLFDSGEADSFLYYVMPFIDGETLRTKLDRETQLGIDEAVRITVAVADALDYAHRHGVIHRDIKPENILLHDGRPMVADFGIALALSAAAGGRMTETGMSLGTPHYMSPEQATAEKLITARSDIYSLGSVLYEMLTGNPPHVGASAQQIIMKIVTEEAAPVTKLRKAVPQNVADAVAKALEKLPADRFSSAKEFGEALENPNFTMVGGTVGLAAAASRRADRRIVAALAVALVAALAFAIVQWRAAHRARPGDVVRFSVPLPSSMLVSNAAPGTNMTLSPDGRTLAYAVVGEDGTARLAVRPLDDASAHTIAGTDGAQQPCFSPDGQWLAYLVGNILWRVQLDGGSPVLIGPTAVGPVGLAWATSGTIIVGTASGLLSLPVNGGPSKILVGPDTAEGDLYLSQPRALDDGNTVLFSIQPTGGPANTTLGILSLKTNRVIRSDLVLLDALGMVDGYLVYITPAGALTAIQLDVTTGRTASNPITLGTRVLTTVAGVSEAAISPGGTLVYQAANAAALIGWVDLQGRFAPLLRDPQVYDYPRLSPDGNQIAMSISTGGRTDVWVYDIASATPTRLTNSGTLNDRPEWTPDGRRVLYRADRGDRSAIWWQPADLSGPPEGLLAGAQHSYYEGVMSPDGDALVYQVDDGSATQADVMYRGMSGDTAARPIAASEFVEAQPRISPDGRWIAYVTDASGMSQVVVQPFPGPGPRVQVSAGGGSEPVWARDGRRLFYRNGQYLIAAAVSTTAGFTVTGRTPLFTDDYMFAQAPHANYDVSLDGGRFLMVKSVQRPELTVVYGWSSELKARLHGAQGR